YHVQEMIGRGGMAEVYKVWDQEMMVHLAMKVLFEDFAIDKVFLRRFKREANTLATLQHPHIVRLYGMEQDGPLAFMLLDFIEGRSLKRAIFDAAGPMAAEQISDILRPVCSALNFAHQRGFVHADIKPANVLINSLGQVYLSDFGIARMTDAATATMVGAGTPAYMAPEQARGMDPAPQSDIYSLGIVLYEMLTGGERPFIGETATITGTTSEKVRWEQVNLEPPSPRLYNPGLSKGMEAVVMKCLAKKPKERWQTPVDLLNAFEQASGGMVEANAKPIETVPSMPPPQIVQELEVAPQQPQEAPVPAEEEAVQLKETPVEHGQAKDVQRVKPGSSSQPEKREGKWWLWIGGMFITLLMGMVMINAGTQGAGPLRALAKATDVPTATPIPTTIFGVGSTRISKKDGMEMVYVPAGIFTMGSADGDDDEQPVHAVYLDGYWIDKYEVTNVQYKECVKENACIEPSNIVDYYDSSYTYRPVVYVSWLDAQDYCEWVGRRLPSEAEWEKAARGTEERTYPWGESIGCEYAQYEACDGSTVEKGSFSKGASAYGALDMAGNVWEWVADWYDAKYYSVSLDENPAGPSSGDYRVLRGGSWRSIESDVQSASRSWGRPVSTTENNIGFRCASSP
ncbi:MAG: SUMF1/EgtB/PvdO family nonheme iron enzyme, partial [Anaerolineaceae bacterium]|nr:SUMF1/EgtB/PvdO family nonheme iron enzyme [Anaerolineaceae bacterium]